MVMIGFTIIPINIGRLEDNVGEDNSKHFRIFKGKHYVDFGILDGEISAYIWGCPHEGRIFLKALEQYAKKNNLKLTIPTVLSPRLEHILEDNGYTKKEVPYLGDICELWSKDAKP